MQEKEVLGPEAFITMFPQIMVEVFVGILFACTNLIGGENFNKQLPSLALQHNQAFSSTTFWLFCIILSGGQYRLHETSEIASTILHWEGRSE